MAEEAAAQKETGTPLYVHKLERYGHVKDLPSVLSFFILGVL